MEYSEPLDDLLEGSDEDSDIDSGEPSKMLDVDQLMSVDDMEVEASASSKDNPILLDMLHVGISDDSDDEDENEREKADRRAASNAELESKRDKIIKLLCSTAPGIDLFPSNTKEENGFLYFDLESLSLERDLEYTRRGKLLGHGFKNETLDEIFTNRREFIRHLFPEAQSVLLCDQSDFKSIMNFLFYSISVCTDEKDSELMTKSFFDLRRNYGFKWYLSLRHIVTVLTNLGVSKEALLNEKFYNKENVGLVKHLEQVKKSGQETDSKYKLPSLPQFLEKKKTSSSSKFLPVSSDKFKFCLSRVIEVVCQFICGFPSHLDFRRKNNWSHQMVLMHILLLLGTDKRLILDIQTKQYISLALHFLIDSFSTDFWRWGPASKPSKRDKETSAEFNHYNPHKSLVRLVHEFFPGEMCPKVKTWNDKGDPVTNHDKKSDHHLNMLLRINLILPTYRGNQLMKYLAFMYLQTLAEVDAIKLPTHVTVRDVTENLDLCDKLSDGIKLIVMSKNYSLTMTLLELYDIIVGYEKEEDFNSETVEHINKLRKCVLAWIQKKLGGLGQNLDINDEKSVKAMQLSEYLDIVENRWKSGCNNV